MQIRIYERQIPRDMLDGIQLVHQSVFEGDLLKEHKLHKPNLVAVIAIIHQQVAGFKLGYEMEDGMFYSWLGGVHPDYQRRGIAKELMTIQHRYCKEQGYQKMRTYSRNARKAMLILNIQAGFDVIATFIDEKGRHKIILEKDL